MEKQEITLAHQMKPQMIEKNHSSMLSSNTPKSSNSPQSVSLKNHAINSFNLLNEVERTQQNFGIPNNNSSLLMPIQAQSA